jgi:Predicted transcriptional regulators
MSKGIGDIILEYRKLNGISQKYLASQIGISTQGLLKIEKGISSPNAKTIEKIVEVLCITPNQLFGLEQVDASNFNILARLREMKT